MHANPGLKLIYMKPTTGFAAPLRLRARLMYDGANYAGV